MPYASALTRLEDPRIKEIGQTEVGMSGKIAYDDEYTGPAFDPAEGVRLARVIGDKTVLFMANHGIATVGETVADAYDRLYYIERAAQVQIYAMWTGNRSSSFLKKWSKRPSAISGAISAAATAKSLGTNRARAAALRCAEAHPRPQGAGLRVVVSAAAGSATTLGLYRKVRHARPCAGIHVLTAFLQERRGWPGHRRAEATPSYGRLSPAITPRYWLTHTTARSTAPRRRPACDRAGWRSTIAVRAISRCGVSIRAPSPRRLWSSPPRGRRAGSVFPATPR